MCVFRTLGPPPLVRVGAPQLNYQEILDSSVPSCWWALHRSPGVHCSQCRAVADVSECHLSAVAFSVRVGRAAWTDPSAYDADQSAPIAYLVRCVRTFGELKSIDINPKK